MQKKIDNTTSVLSYSSGAEQSTQYNLFGLLICHCGGGRNNFLFLSFKWLDEKFRKINIFETTTTTGNIISSIPRF